MTDVYNQSYNKTIAQSFGLDEELDFINNSQALHEAEKEIQTRGLDKDYLQALNEMDSTKLDKKSLDDFKTKPSGFRAFAIVKLLRKIKEE